MTSSVRTAATCSADLLHAWAQACPGLPGPEAASLIDNPEAGIVRRGIPAVLASVDPAVDHGVALAGSVTDAGTPPEGHDDLARTPGMPLRARGRVWPPDRKVVRQVAFVHRHIRTHEPSRRCTAPRRQKEALDGPPDAADNAGLAVRLLNQIIDERVPPGGSSSGVTTGNHQARGHQRACRPGDEHQHRRARGEQACLWVQCCYLGGGECHGEPADVGLPR
jgi:hypothetical protein